MTLMSLLMSQCALYDMLK